MVGSKPDIKHIVQLSRHQVKPEGNNVIILKRKTKSIFERKKICLQLSQVYNTTNNNDGS